MPTPVRLVKYVRREDPGDLVYGYIWRDAVYVGEPLQFDLDACAEHEARMFDYETGEPVGDTFNYCLMPTPLCYDVGCGGHRPLGLIP